MTLSNYSLIERAADLTNRGQIELARNWGSSPSAWIFLLLSWSWASGLIRRTRLHRGTAISAASDAKEAFVKGRTAFVLGQGGCRRPPPVDIVLKGELVRSNLEACEKRRQLWGGRWRHLSTDIGTFADELQLAWGELLVEVPNEGRQYVENDGFHHPLITFANAIEFSF